MSEETDEIAEAMGRASEATVREVNTSARARPLMLAPERVQAFDADRTGLLTWIKEHFVPRVDFGPATSHGGAKDTLLKPGAEKLCLLFGWTARLSDDHEVRAMLGNPPTLIAFKCGLFSEQGQLVAEGRGACDLTERPPRAINSAIKIAEKRAVVDAVLRACGLSELFTQDLEDMVPDPGEPPPDGRVYGASGTPSRTQAQLDRLSQIPPNRDAQRADLMEDIVDLQFRLQLTEEQMQAGIKTHFAPAAGGKARKLADLNIEELEVLRDRLSASPKLRTAGGL